MKLSKEYGFTPYQDLDEMLEAITADYIDSDVEKEIVPKDETLFGIMIPSWPLTTKGKPIEYKKEGPLYWISSKALDLLVPGNEMAENAMMDMTKKNVDLFYAEDYNNPIFRFYCPKSNIEGIDDHSIIYLRNSINIGTVEHFIINGVMLYSIRKEHIIGHKKL